MRVVVSLNFWDDEPITTRCHLALERTLFWRWPWEVEVFCFNFLPESNALFGGPSSVAFYLFLF